jgi:hypothetical protein
LAAGLASAALAVMPGVALAQGTTPSAPVDRSTNGTAAVDEQIARLRSMGFLSPSQVVLTAVDPAQVQAAIPMSNRALQAVLDKVMVSSYERRSGPSTLREYLGYYARPTSTVGMIVSDRMVFVVYDR